MKPFEPQTCLAIMAVLSSLPGVQPHALALPYPAQGHITSLMRLCKVLSSRGLVITFVSVDRTPRRTPASLDEPTTYQESPLVAVDENLRIAKVPLYAPDVRPSLNQFMEALEGLSTELEKLWERLSKEGHPVTCVISDMMVSSVTQKLADKFNAPRISHFPFNQSFNLFWFYMLNGQISKNEALNVLLEGGRTAERFQEALPGLPAICKEDLPNFKPYADDNECMYSSFVRQSGISFEKAQAIVVNSFDELESSSLEAMRRHLRQPLYSMGPLIEEVTDGSSTNIWKQDSECLQWLEEQPLRSVVYIAFGSTGRLSQAQIEELLVGLEASNQRFLWAFHPSLVDGIANGSIPSDFLSKTKDRGYVVGWVPQLRVLSHPSVGGFLTHCGWNSTMEAIASGVPMLCWPYFADQFMIAKCVVEEWKIGLRFEVGGGGLVGRGEVQRVVNELMEGETVRTNALQMRDAGRRSLEEGGSSHYNIEAFRQCFS